MGYILASHGKSEVSDLEDLYIFQMVHVPIAMLVCRSVHLTSGI